MDQNWQLRLYGGAECSYQGAKDGKGIWIWQSFGVGDVIWLGSDGIGWLVFLMFLKPVTGTCSSEFLLGPHGRKLHCGTARRSGDADLQGVGRRTERGGCTEGQVTGSDDLANFSPNVSTLRGSYGKCKARVRLVFAFWSARLNAPARAKVSLWDVHVHFDCAGLCKTWVPLGSYLKVYFYLRAMSVRSSRRSFFDYPISRHSVASCDKTSSCCCRSMQFR